MWRDVSFFDDHCEVFIEQSKTDQERVGVWVVIAAAEAGSRGICPVRVLRKLLEAGNYAERDAGAERALPSYSRCERDPEPGHGALPARAAARPVV